MPTENVSILFALAAGLLSFISPCCLPMVPAYVGYLSGRVAATPAGVQIADRRATFFHALFFVLGFGAVFTALGASAGLLGFYLRDYLPLVRPVGAAMLVLFGLQMMGVIRLNWLYREIKIGTGPGSRGGYLASFLVGNIFAAGWTPCVGLVLSGVLLLASNTQTAGQGALLLATYSLGLGIPFLLTGLALDRVTPLLHALNRRGRAVEIVSGLFIISMGVLVYFNVLQRLSIFFFKLFGPVPFL